MISISNTLHRTFRIYAKQHALPPVAAVLIAAFVALDRTPGKRPLWVGIVAVLLALITIGLFVCVVVLLVADDFDGGPHRSARELLRAAWSALPRLLLVGVFETITITVVSSIAPVLVIGGGLAIVVTNGGGSLLALILVVPLILILLLVLQLWLYTSWSVSVAVVVLEHPGGLRALGRARRRVVASERNGDIAPLLLSRALPQLTFDAREDLGELAVVECPDEDDASVWASGFGPLARERREVPAVARDEHALFRCGQLEHLRVGKSLEGGVFGQREHVMAVLAQLRGDGARGEIRVEQQPQGYLRGR